MLFGFDNNVVGAHVFMDDDTGGGAGGSSDTAVVDDAVDQPTLTQKQYEEQLARNRQEQARKHEKALKAKEEQLAALQTKLADLEKKLSAQTSQSAGDKEGVRGEAALITEDLKKQLSDLNSRLAEAEHKREQAEQARRDAQRDSELKMAIAAANPTDPVLAERYFAPMVIWDEQPLEEDKPPAWRIRSPKGGYVDINSENIKRLLPEILQPGQAAGGGSGSRGGAGSYSQRANELETEKKKLEALAQRARGGRNEDILIWQSQVRKVKELEAKLAEKK